MKVKMIQNRRFAKIGQKMVGDVLDVDKTLGNQLIAQGFAVEMSKATPPPKKEFDA